MSEQEDSWKDLAICTHITRCSAAVQATQYVMLHPIQSALAVCMLIVSCGARMAQARVGAEVSGRGLLDIDQAGVHLD